MTEKVIPVDWFEHLIVCDGCGSMATKDWAKQGAKGLLCMRCAENTEGYLMLKRIGEI